MTDIQTRIKEMLQYLQQDIYEKDTEIALALLAALSGESILLLGPPGVAKSMVARRMKLAFKGAKSFEYLMSRFSTPDEIFGPVSIARLKESDKYERATEGFLPTADIVFLDEIWKAGPAIQNTLLTVMNEKLFRNGSQELRLPLKLLIAASNELPAKGEGLEALWDRFIVRIVCQCIQNEDVFRQMLCNMNDIVDVTKPMAKTKVMPITHREYTNWQKEAQEITLDTTLLNAITYIRQHLQRVEVEGSELTRHIYISDRRWKHIARLLRTSAYSQGRNMAQVTDLLPMYHCLWNEPDEIAPVRRITLASIFAPYKERIEQLANGVKADLRAQNAQAALAKAVRDNDHRDDNLLIYNRLFYQVENHGTGHTYVFITDFKRMPMRSKVNAPAQGIIYPNPTNTAQRIVRLFSPDVMSGIPSSQREQVTLCRDNSHIYINGVAFNMRQRGSALLDPSNGKVGGGLFNTPIENPTNTKSTANAFTHYEDDIETVCNELDNVQRQVNDNLYVNKDDKREIETYLQQLYKQIALCRVDIRKLLYDE